MSLLPGQFGEGGFLLLVVDLLERSAWVGEVVAEGGELFGFLLLLLLDVLLRVVDDEELLLGPHLAADVAAVEGAVPLLLVLLGLELHVDVESLLVLLDGEHDEDVGLGVVVHVLNFVQFDALEVVALLGGVEDTQLVWFEHH